MKSLTEKPKAGYFRAVCKKARLAPVSEVPDLPEDAYTRWDTKLKCEVTEVRCDLDTTDRAEFERHMAEVHGRKPGPHMTGHRGHAAFNPKPWKAPRLTADGKPWDPKDRRTWTCPDCGTVCEDGPVAADHAAECEHRAVA